MLFRSVSTEASTTYTYSQLENTTYKLRVKVSDVAGNISTSRVLNGTYCSGGSTVQEDCGTCNGTGTYGTESKTCTLCNGTGTYGTEQVSCNTCGGQATGSGTCPDCKGSRTSLEGHTLIQKTRRRCYTAFSSMYFLQEIL